GLVVACSSGSSEKSGAVVAKAEVNDAAKQDAKAGARSDDAKPVTAKDDARARELPAPDKGEKAVSPVQPLAVDPPEPSAKPVQPVGLVAPEAMLDDLLDGKLVAYSPKDGAVAYAIGGSVEGTGLLLSLAIRTADDKVDDLEICSGDPECETTSKSKAKRDE